MAPGVKQAIEELRIQYPNYAIKIAADKHGGAFVVIEGMPLGSPYIQSDTWVGFHITYNCPYADTYPHFVRSDLSRQDNNPPGEGMTSGHSFPQQSELLDPNSMPARPAIQVSRVSRRREATETPRLKLIKVLQWIINR